MLKRVAIVTSALAVVIVLLAVLGAKNSEFTSKLKSNLKSAVSIERSDAVDNNLIRIYIDIHHMSHRVVIADEKWGEKDLSLENIQALIRAANEISETVDTTEVLEILLRWEKGDFSRADKDHNFVWSKLGGTVGIATGVNEQAVPEWAKELSGGQP